MNKILVASLAAISSAAVFAGMNDVVISFSTPGPDKYADGTEVVDGEKYALVWTPNGEEFAGVNANGTAAGNSRVIATVPSQGNCCPGVFFEVDEDWIAEEGLKNGVWSVVLLDTRTFLLKEDGTPVIEDGVRKFDKLGNEVNGYGVVGSAKVASAQGGGSSIGGAAAATGFNAADIAAPVVKGITFDDKNVYVTVTATKPAFKYSLSAGDAPDAIVAKDDDTASFGSAQDIVLIKPKKAGGEFFKVNCK